MTSIHFIPYETYISEVYKDLNTHCQVVGQIKGHANVREFFWYAISYHEMIGCASGYCYNLVIAIVLFMFLHLWQQCSEQTVKTVLSDSHPCDSFPIVTSF